MEYFMKISPDLYSQFKEGSQEVSVILTFDSQKSAERFNSPHFSSTASSPLGDSGTHMLVGTLTSQGVEDLESYSSLKRADLDQEVSTFQSSVQNFTFSSED
jgi:hypothetical protein